MLLLKRITFVYLILITWKKRKICFSLFQHCNECILHLQQRILWCFLFHLKSSFRSQFPFSLLLLSVSHCFRAWSKKIPKVYDAINRLNKNLTHFVWYLEKEKSYVIETYIEYYTKNILVEKSCRKCESKASSRPLFFSLKQPLHARNYFLKENYQKPFKEPFFPTQSLLMDKVIKSKRNLELVTSCSLGYQTSSETFFY